MAVRAHISRSLLALALAAVAFPAPACKALEKAASEDPLKCERDPKCEKKRGRQNDCSTQCVDDPACVDRCMQVQKGTIGH